MARKKSTQQVSEKIEELQNTDILPDDPPVKDWLSTGISIMDFAVANQYPGGIPMGRITELYSPPSSGKSVFGMALAGAMQRLGGIVSYQDIESTFDKRWASMYGLNCDADTFNLVTREKAPQTIEELFDVHICKLVKMDDPRPKLCVIDTVAALSSNAEVSAPGLGKGMGMSRAKILSEAHRVYSPCVTAEANLTILMLNQLRDKVETFGTGPKTTVPGGWANKFMGSVRIRLTYTGKIKNSKGVATGIQVKFDIEKNKVGPPFRSGTFPLYFDYGLDDITACLEFLKQYQEAPEDKSKKKSKKVDTEDEEKIRKNKPVVFNGETKPVASMIKYVEANGLEEVLRKAVFTLWQEVHKGTERKLRTWV